MGVYRQCPTCGNTSKNDGVYVCNDCRHFFCESCAVEEFDHFPLPFTSKHCPRCNGKNIRSVGLIDMDWQRGY